MCVHRFMLSNKDTYINVNFYTLDVCSIGDGPRSLDIGNGFKIT